MKNIKFITLAVSMFLLMLSCDKLLDVEPQQSVSAETVYNDHEGVINAINGAWASLGSSNLFAGTSVFQSDLLANNDELEWIGTFIGYQQMFDKNLSVTDGTISGKWNTAYNLINITNNVLANIEVVHSGHQERVEGEAKFLRGVAYFELVRFYARHYGATPNNSHPGVPLVLTPTVGITEDSYPERATVEAVYTQILSDLNRAKSLLAPGGAGANGGRATSTNASAFLARVYLSMKNWQSAANEADIVIDQFGGAAALNDLPRSAFNNDVYTTEDVFMIRQDATSHAGSANTGIGTFFSSLPGYGRGDAFVTSAHRARFEEGDLRNTYVDDPEIRSIGDVPAMYYRGVGTDAGNTMTAKWGKWDANIPVIRLAEMFLTRAEANYMHINAGGTVIGDAPLDDINVIRSRAGLDPLSELDLEDIKNERMLELCFEGHKLHDLKRWEGFTADPTGTELPYDSPRLVMPVPQREIDVNDNLVQNDGYM